MTEIKTLKDLPLTPIDLDRDELYEILKKCNFDNTEVFRERAKQEAIKRIKEKFIGNSTHGNCCTCTDCKNYHDDCKCDIIKEFKEFFNIIEEDLK